MPRIVGISRKPEVPSLLSTFQNQGLSTTGSIHAQELNHDINRPPDASSDEETEIPPSQPDPTRLYPSYSSDSELSSLRSDIEPTAFSRGKTKKQDTVGEKQSPRRASARLALRERSTLVAKRKAEEDPFLKSRVKKQRNPHRYGAATKKKSKLDIFSPVISPRKERPSLRKLAQSESPEKRSTRKRLWVPDDDTPKKGAGERVRGLDHISSFRQEKARSRPGSSQNSVVKSSADPTGSFASMTSLSAPSTVSTRLSRMSRSNTRLNFWKIERLLAEDVSQTPNRERKPLILPDKCDEELLEKISEPPATRKSYPDLSITGSSLSSPPSNLVSDDDDFLVSTPGKDNCGADKPRCPTCHEPVEQSLLDEWRAARPRFDKSSRDQAMFCNAHQRETAKASYKKRGYPDIDWVSLPKRVKKLDGMIEELLGDDGTSPDSSVFAKEYAELVKTGRERTLLQASTVEGNGFNGNSSCGGLSPGYYGPRAVAIIDRDVMKRFAGSIRRKAVKNALLSVRGKTMFIYRVIVPAVVARLVMKDLGYDFERAREVMAESAEIGRLVCEDLDEEGQDG